MSGEFINAVSRAARIFLIGATDIILWSFQLDMLLRRKRSLVVLRSWMLLRAFIITSVINVILRQYYEDRDWWPWFFFGVMVVVVIGNCATLFYTFEGTKSKVLAGSYIAEIVLAPVNYLASGIINCLEGQSFDTLESSIQLTDIAIPVLSILLFLIVNHFLRPVCNRFRDYQLHFSNLLWGLVIINVFSYLPSFSKTTNYLVMSVVISLAIALMILYNVIKHVKITKAEKALLTKQKQMTEEHAASIQQQTEQMETYHQAADTQISAFDSENLQSYVENLKQQQQKVWGGTYCSDHMIDAILASQTEKMKNKGYSLQCHLFGYDRGCIAEKDLAQLLMYIFAWSEESVSSKSTSDHSIDLRMSVVTNQLMIEYRMPSANHTNNVRRMLHPLVKKYHGKIGWQKEGTYDVLNIMLERAFLSLL